jgi:putative glutamine amidotransferase
MLMMVELAGGTLDRVDGHVATSHGIEVVASSPWPLRDGREVNSFHDWGIAAADQLGGGLVALAVAPDGSVEAAAHAALPQVGVMWHPERPPADPDDLDLIRTLISRCP